MQENDKLKREIESLRTRLLRMSEASHRITESLDLETVLQEVVDCARSLTGARYGALTVFDDSGKVQDLITSGITPAERRKMGPMPKGVGLIGFLNEVRAPLRLADLSKHPRSVGLPDFLPPMKTFLGSPIRHLGEPVGNIYLTEKEGGQEFTKEDEEAIVMFASLAARAISNARIHKEEQQARGDAETERERLANLVKSSPLHLPGVSPNPGGKPEQFQEMADGADPESTPNGKLSMVGSRARILSLDDHPHFLRYIEFTLLGAGYVPFVTEKPDEMLHLLRVEQPNLVLLDLVLPGTSGFDLMKPIREISDAPVIFLSGFGSEENIVRALELGADDYVVKPFSPKELVARIESALRKQRILKEPAEREPFRLEDVTIDYETRLVTVSGGPVKITGTEYRLLFELSTNAGRVMTHDQLLQQVWGTRYSGDERLLRVFIGNLRRKLGDDAKNPNYIFTEPLVGYRMAKA